MYLPATSTQVLVYEALLSFLKDACSTNLVGSTEGANLRKILDGYLVSMACDSAVTAIVESLKWRKTLLKVSSQLGLSNDSKLRIALRTDDERIASILVAIFDSKSAEAAVLRLENDSAQYFLDVVQNALDKGFLLAEEDSRRARRIIRKLSGSCDLLPSSLFFTGVSKREEHPTFGGGFGDIFRASHDGTPLALKRMRHFLRGSDLRRIRLKFCREALVWKDLQHPHILPFLGIDQDSFPPPSLCMVSPWMEHGTVINYLENHGHENVDKLLYEIAQGLEYLHSRNIVHGDLKGANILIKEDWSACLTDFGLSKFSDATSAMTSNRGGSLYWMAPELLDPDRFGYQFARTQATDVYAFGCVCFELYTGRPPFASLTEPAAFMKILNGERPAQPTDSPVMSDTLWRHVSTYWADSPTARPTTQVVVQNMIWTKSSRLPPLLPTLQSAPSFFPIPLSQPEPSSLPTPVESSSVLPRIDPTFSPQSFTDDTSPGVDSDPVMDEILYDYTTPTDDPYETPISFSRGETVHVLHQEGAWCEVENNDGSIGIVPSDCLHNTRGSLSTEDSPPENRDNEHKKTSPSPYSDSRISLPDEADDEDDDERGEDEEGRDDDDDSSGADVPEPPTQPLYVPRRTQTQPTAASDFPLPPPTLGGQPPSQTDAQAQALANTQAQALAYQQAQDRAAAAMAQQQHRQQQQQRAREQIVPQAKQPPSQQQAQTLRKKMPPVLGIKKLFSREKPKDQPLQPLVQQTPLTTPIHQQFASRPRSSTDDDRWEVVDQHTPPLPPGASPPVPSPTGVRSPSPYTVVPQAKQPPSQQQGQTLRKKTPPVLGIMHSLEPVLPHPHPGHMRNKSEEWTQPESMVPPPQKEKEKKGGWFFGRREPRRDDENELTRKIDFLAATASEDWTLVLDVCDHASATEANAKEAVRALRREFKYGEPAAQLATARLWAIMLRKSSDTFINQSTSKKFLDTLEDLLTNSRTSPVVRERIMDVLAAAAYASGSKKDVGFRGLWRRVKPRDKPEEGMPFDTEDAMFNPPLMTMRPSATYDYDPNGIIVSAPPIVYHDATPIVPDMPFDTEDVTLDPPLMTGGCPSATYDYDPNGINANAPPIVYHDATPIVPDTRERQQSRRHCVIPPDEDMRHLFQECKIGVVNANLFSQALAMATPEQLNDSAIMESYKKCVDSQELIFAQISWASAGAERSREQAEQKERERARTRKISSNTLNSINLSLSDLSLSTSVLTREEELLADLLASNERLLEAIELYDGLKRVALERKVEDRSQREVKMDPRLRQYVRENDTLHSDSLGMLESPSHSRSPSPADAHVVPVPHTFLQDEMQDHRNSPPPAYTASSGQTWTDIKN